MHRVITIFWTLQILVLGLSSTAFAQQRVALVIGNSAYKHAVPLKNPENDAQEITKKLKGLGFDVVTGINLKHRQFARAISTFKRKLAFADVALFFYAGHGLQINGSNYLMPVDAQLDDETSLDFEAVQLNTILRLMERRPRINLVFLDACRDNPIASNLSRSLGTRSASVGRGLAPVESGVGTLIAYATQPGNVALDGDATNSPFTRSLVKHIATPNLDIALMMRRVRQDVIGETGGRQIPWQHSSLTTPFMFNKQAPVKAAVAQIPANTVVPGPSLARPPSHAMEIAFWQSATAQNSKGAYQAYIEKFPNGNFTPLAKLKLGQFLGVAALDSKQKPPQPTVRAFEPMPLAEPPETNDMSTTKMARALQNELKRAGCRPGKVDSKWGHQGARALARFNKATRSSVATGEPTLDAIKLVKSHKRNICVAALPQKDKKAKQKNTNRKVKNKAKAANKKILARQSRSKGKKCKYEPLGACEERLCSIEGTGSSCIFLNAASRCKKGGKYRRKTC